MPNLKKSPELAQKVYELLIDRAYEFKFETDWIGLMVKYNIDYVNLYFNQNNDNEMFQIMNSPIDQFIYVADPFKESEYVLKIPIEVATKIVVLGTLP